MPGAVWGGLEPPSGVPDLDRRQGPGSDRNRVPTGVSERLEQSSANTNRYQRRGDSERSPGPSEPAGGTTGCGLAGRALGEDGGQDRCRRPVRTFRSLAGQDRPASSSGEDGHDLDADCTRLLGDGVATLPESGLALHPPPRLGCGDENPIDLVWAGRDEAAGDGVSGLPISSGPRPGPCGQGGLSARDSWRGI
jgi:hypothetical protein